MPIHILYTSIDTTVTGRAYYILTGQYLEFVTFSTYIGFMTPLYLLELTSPTSISQISTPRPHQSTALVQEVSVSTSGARNSGVPQNVLVLSPNPIPEKLQIMKSKQYFLPLYNLFLQQVKPLSRATSADTVVPGPVLEAQANEVKHSPILPSHTCFSVSFSIPNYMQ